MKLLKMNKKDRKSQQRNRNYKEPQGNFRTNIITETKISLDGLNGVTEEKAAYLKIDEESIQSKHQREKDRGKKMNRA